MNADERAKVNRVVAEAVKDALNAKARSQGDHVPYSIDPLDYCSDLNAIVEACGVLGWKRWSVSFGNRDPWGKPPYLAIVHVPKVGGIIEYADSPALALTLAVVGAIGAGPGGSGLP